jgi:hypothetical protein
VIIKFTGNEPPARYYRVGVQGDNGTGCLVFELAAEQGGVSLAEYKPFLKMQTPDLSFADKDGNLEITPDGDGVLRLRYALTRAVTRNRSVDMQLQFEDYSAPGVAVWQTAVFNVSFAPTLPAEGTVADNNPTILQDHEKRIHTLETAPAPVFEAQSRFGFPAVGAAGIVYIDRDANATYRFDIDTGVYYVIGSDYNDIKTINANGGTD